jgi:hypothetical protein
MAGLTDGRAVLVTTRPFRGLLHTISDVVLIGGGPMFCREKCLWLLRQTRLAWRPKF